MQVTLDLPDILDFRSAEEASRKVLEAVVIQACKKGTISQGKAGELLGLSFGETEEFFTRHRIPLSYDLNDFNKDRAALLDL